MSNLIKHAEYELGLLGNDSMQLQMNTHLLAMVKLFSEEEHSGFSASYAINALKRLLMFEPLTPLTGEDHEWTEVYEGTFQNKRCPHVFKDSTGTYDSQGIIFREPDGCCYQGPGSRVYISFPYTPKTEYVDRPASD